MNGLLLYRANGFTCDGIETCWPTPTYSEPLPPSALPPPSPTDSANGGCMVDPNTGVAYQGALTGIASEQGRYPNLLANNLNLTFAQVQQTIQEGRAARSPVFKL